MFDKLSATEQQYEELLTRLGSVETQNDPAEYRKHAKALAEIEELVERFREYKAVTRDIAQTEELASHGDPGLRELVQEELKTLVARREALVADLKVLLVPRDPNDDKNVFACPCHTGFFDIKTGAVLGGPPPRQLDRLDVRVEDGALFARYQDFRLGVPEKAEV